ncbi:MAG TPA: penicillin-binding protein 2 [Candidatus Limnocylindrales bacterium]|nr:penicillin-binding protein 2 [Candidatus Limnocylindrales bacterium]
MGRTDSRGRALVLLIVFAIVGSALFARLAYWQVVQRDRLAEEAFAQTSIRVETPSRRGDIYDRSGVVVLATTIDRERLIANPSEMTATRRAEVGAALVTILGLEGEEADLLTSRISSDRKYVVLARALDTAAADRIRKAIASDEIEAVGLEPEPVRVYPQEGGGPDTTLAAKLLGFVNREGVGQYGVEQYYQDQLAGRPRVVQAQRDIAARTMAGSSLVKDAGAAGEDIRLTIDAGLQLAVEQEVLAAWAADEARSVSAVVLDPYSGEILAEASYPSYDGNDYAAIAASDPSRFIDPVISSSYEPGSVFKMLTAVAGLEAKDVTIKTKINDTGTLKLDRGTARIDDADHKAMGWMTFEDAIAWSRNVVAAKVALGLDKNVRTASSILHSTWSRFGFGQPTGVDLAGEVGGIVHDPAIRQWRQIDLANGSFGQGVAVTPLQLATSYAIMVNGGQRIRPHVVKAVGMTEAATTEGERVISASLSKTLVYLMNHVVETVPFYANRTLIDGYQVGGKTGTAQIWDSKARGGKGAWKHNIFNYSFIGYIGRSAGRPDLVVAVRIEEGRPTVRGLGQLEMPVMSFELFKRIAHDAIRTPDLLPARTAPADSTTANR